MILILLPLGTWLSYNGSLYIFSGNIVSTDWGYGLNVTGLVLSLTVNAFVTGLIVFRIFKVFREVKATLDNQILGATGGNKLRDVIFIIIESGMALFSIQLARLVVSIVWTDAAQRAFNIIVFIHEMLNVITTLAIAIHYFTDDMGLVRE